MSIDDLAKIDVRVGTIERVEDIERSDKAVKLSVNFGDHTRTILAGVKQEREDLAELEGAQALFVINLEPRKIWASYRRECCSTSGNRMASSPRSPCRNGASPMVHGWGSHSEGLRRIFLHRGRTTEVAVP
jgi:tRNA-binding protein